MPKTTGTEKPLGSAPAKREPADLTPQVGLGTEFGGARKEDQRKAKATELIDAALALEKVDVTGKIQNAVSLTIDLAAVLFLPKSHADTQSAGTADVPAAG